MAGAIQGLEELKLRIAWGKGHWKSLDPQNACVLILIPDSSAALEFSHVANVASPHGHYAQLVVTIVVTIVIAFVVVFVVPFVVAAIVAIVVPFVVPFVVEFVVAATEVRVHRNVIPWYSTAAPTDLVFNCNWTSN